MTFSHIYYIWYFSTASNFPDGEKRRFVLSSRFVYYTRSPREWKHMYKGSLPPFERLGNVLGSEIASFSVCGANAVVRRESFWWPFQDFCWCPILLRAPTHLFWTRCYCRSLCCPCQLFRSLGWSLPFLTPIVSFDGKELDLLSFRLESAFLPKMSPKRLFFLAG